MFKVAPIPSSFMLISMFGFIISAFFLTDPIVKSWAWAFVIVFTIMFVSSMISLSKTSLDLEHMEHLAIHNKGHYNKKK